MAIYDSWNPAHKSVFGALKTGEKCTFTIDLAGLGAYNPLLVIYRPYYKESFLSMTYAGNSKFTVDFTPEESGVYFYYFAVQIDGTRRFIRRKHGHEARLDDGQDFQLTVYDADFKTPDFIKGGTMYQIFPDRFFKSRQKHDNIPEGRILRKDWGGTPSFAPDSEGKVKNNDFFGGDLHGIELKLPYLKEMGVTCIYLNPIFESHENHRYSTADYMKVDPLLGTNEDFSKLCKSAKKLGISIILDGVFSHTGADSIYFNKYNRYDTVGAYNSKESPYNEWYSFRNFPDDYESWWGFETLPNVVETNEKYLDFICGKKGVLEYWLSKGAAGYRLDVADELPDEFLDELRKTVKAKGEENLIIGEVWEDASNKESYGKRRRYLNGKQLDSVMNYPFKDAIIDYMITADAKKFVRRIMTIFENYPKPSLNTLMTSLSTHDTPRLLTRLIGREIGDKAEQAVTVLPDDMYNIGVKLSKCAAVLQFFLPGVPCVYYGDEAGMQGYQDPFNRGCFDWNNINEELHSFYTELGKIRGEQSCLKEGTFEVMLATGDTFVFSRFDDKANDGILVYLNKSHFPQDFATDCEYWGGFKCDGAVRGEIIDGHTTIAPFDYAVYKISAK